MNEDRMTVAELIAELQKQPQDAIVWADGRNWNQTFIIKNVIFDEHNQVVLIQECDG